MDAGGKLTKAEVAKSVDFCLDVIEKIEKGCLARSGLSAEKPGGERGAAARYSADELCDATLMKIVRVNRVMDLAHFTADIIDGMKPTVERGALGLVKAT